MKKFKHHVTDYAERLRHRLAYILWIETMDQRVSLPVALGKKPSSKRLALVQAD